MKLSDVTHPLYLAVFPQSAVITPRAHGIDVSKYDLFFEPLTATGQLDFVIQRVSYRTTRDEAFLNLVPGVMSMPIRGGYHYLNSDRTWREQADAYLSFASGYDYHFHACDFESAFNTMTADFAYQAWQWIQYVRGRTGKPVLLYTSPSLYNQYVTPSQSKYGIDWNTVPLWTAQWFFTPNPNGTPTMPSGRTGGWRFWQYTDRGDGTLYGVARPTACDLDVFNGSLDELRTWLGIQPKPEYEQLRRHESDVHIVRLDKYNYRELVTDTKQKLETVSSAAKRWGAKIAVNGDGWTKDVPPVALSLAMSDGNLYQSNQFELRPFVRFGMDGTAMISHTNKAGAWNMISGTRYLVQNGAVNPALFGTQIQYLEKHPRSAVGIDAAGGVILCVVDGRSAVSAGVTLSQLAGILAEQGAVWGLELDGGGSSALWYEGRIVNKPSDGSERGVINHLVFVGGGEMANGTAKEVLGKTGTVRTSPEVVSGNDTGKRVAPFSTIQFVRIVDGKSVQADKWFQLPDGNFLNYIIGGRYYFQVLTDPTPEPEPEPIPDMPAYFVAYDSENNPLGRYNKQ